MKSGAVNPARKLATMIGGMMCGADSIDDMDVLRAGGTTRVFDGVYAPQRGDLLARVHLRARQPTRAVVREHLAALAARAGCCPASRAGVLGHRLAVAPGLRARQAGRLLRAHQDRRQQVLRQGLSPLITTICTAGRADDRRDAAARGKAGSGRRRPAGQAGDRHRPRCRGDRKIMVAATRRTAPKR